MTEAACKQIKIIDEKPLSQRDRELLKTESMNNRNSGIALGEEMCRRYRREGRYFDEILKGGE